MYIAVVILDKRDILLSVAQLILEMVLFTKIFKIGIRNACYRTVDPL